MDFLKEVLDRLKQFFWDGILALDRVNLAIAEGKALDQLQERLIGSHIQAEFTLENISSSLSNRKGEVQVRFESPEELSQEVQFHIHETLAALCLRYQINIRAEFLSGVGQSGDPLPHPAHQLSGSSDTLGAGAVP